MGQRRAKAGGEYGANGEWYEGGKFIANTDRAKSKPRPYKKTGRQQITRDEWAVPPEGYRSLFSRWCQLWAFHPDGSVTPRDGLNVEYWGADIITQSIEALEKWKQGERWYPVTDL